MIQGKMKKFGTEKMMKHQILSRLGFHYLPPIKLEIRKKVLLGQIRITPEELEASKDFEKLISEKYETLKVLVLKTIESEQATFGELLRMYEEQDKY